ncbi:MAG: hypothetical protein VB064_13200 [Oscillospiraceae bacterium]|nr:hypothetical protein [Oscillospiraceae bacterium]
MKKIISIIIALAMCVSLVPSAFAENSSTESTSTNQLLSSEIKTIDGIDFEVNRYSDNGYIVETIGLASTNEDVYADDLKNALKQLDDSRMLQQSASQSVLSNPIGQRSSVTKTEYFSNSGVNPSNNRYAAWHYWSFTSNGFLGTLTLNDGWLKGGVEENPAPSQIQLSETITVHGLVGSISWPAGVSVTPGSNSSSWTSLGYTNTLEATAYRSATSATRTSWIGFHMTVVSSSTCYVGSASYSAATQSSLDYAYTT